MPPRASAAAPFLAAFLVLLLAFVANASDTHQGTITLRQGEIIEDASFTIDDRLRVVRVTLDEGRRVLLFDDIESITSRGVDVTEDLLARRPIDVMDGPVDDAPDSPWLVSDDPVRAEAIRKPFRAALSLTGHGIAFAGDYYEGLGPGLGVGVSAIVPVQPRVGLRFAVERSWPQPEGFPLTVDDPESGATITLDIETHETTFLVSAVLLQFSQDESRAVPAFAYLHGGVGMIAQNVCAVATGPSMDGGTVTVRECDDEFDFLTTLGAGGMIPLDDSLFVEFGADINFQYVDAYDARGNETFDVAFMFRLRLGVSVLF